MSKKNRVSTGLPPAGYLLVDLIGMLLTVGPGAFGWACLFLYLRAVWSLPPPAFFAACLAAPVVVVPAFVIALFALRCLLPRLKRGVYPMGVNKGVFGWFCHLALSRSAEVSGLRPLLNAFYLTKFLHWRALGMKIPYGVNTSIGVSFVDLSLISIGAGCTISEGVHIACHTFVGDRLFLSPVEIGANVFVGMNCVLGPKTRIGDGAWIGMSNLVSESIAPGAKISDFQWEHGNPARGHAKDKEGS